MRDDVPDFPHASAAAEGLLAAIVDSADDAIISKSLEGIITSWNPAAERMFGYTAAEAVGRPVSLIIPPERGVEEPQTLAKIKRGERVDHFETVRIRKDGRRIQVSLTISPVRNGRGEIVGASKIARDIGAQRQAEELLRQERQRLQVTLSSIGDAVIVTDARGYLEFLNPVAEELTGWKQDDAQGKPLEAVFDIVNEKSRQRVENPAASAMRQGSVIGLANHTVLIGRNGLERAIDDSAAPIRDADGTTRGVVLVFRDVTGMRAAEEFRARLAAIVESSDDAIIGKDLNGRIMSWNEAAERIFGYSAEEAIGRPISMLIPPERLSEETEIIQRLKRGERLEHFDTIRLRKDGREVHVSLTISPIRDAEGEVVGASKIARDISERKKAEDDLAEATRRMTMHAEDLEKEVQERTRQLRETIADLETFSYSLSHDLRAPLRTMRGFAEAVLEDCGQNVGAEAKDMLTRIVLASARLGRLVDNVLSYTRLSRADVKLETVALDQLVPSVIEDYPNAKDAQAEVHIERPLLPVIGNEGLLTQAIANLVSNAVKFVPAATKPKLRIGTHRSDSVIRLWFEDNGIGIADTDRKKLFNLFTRLGNAKGYEGSGIGLAIVDRAVKKMGGDTGVDSELGKGSMFWIELKPG